MREVIEFIVLIIILIVNIFILFSFIGFFWSSKSGAPFVPSGNNAVQKMVELANIQKGDKVYDLGCGDGRLVFLAAEKGADAVGVEISYPVFLWAKLLQKIKKKQGTLIRGSLWEQDVKDADVIFLYLFPKMVARFEEEMFPTLKKGCRVVAHGFDMKKHTPEVLWRPEGQKTGKILVYRK